jgi:hypothetical protein
VCGGFYWQLSIQRSVMAFWRQTPKWPAVYGGSHRADYSEATNTYRKVAQVLTVINACATTVQGL